jgi:hypothetical protein
VAEHVKDRDDSNGEKKPSVMEYLGLKKKVSDLQQIAHAMQMKVLFLSPTLQCLPILMWPHHGVNVFVESFDRNNSVLCRWRWQT